MNLKNKRVLVTGAGGFIGSHLVETLVPRCAHLRALVHYNGANTWGCLEFLAENQKKNIEVVLGDIRDAAAVAAVVKDCDVVFHLAALIAIPYSYHAPESYVDTNIKGTLNILLASRQYQCERVLLTSTSEVYGTARYVPIDEAHPLQGQSPYSATKIGADKLAEAFRNSFQLPITIVRPFNTYGPRQSARAVIPIIITQMLAGAKKIKLGSLTPTRDFVFVKDTARGFVEIARSDKAVGEQINIATQKEISIGDLVGLLAEITGNRIETERQAGRVRPKTSEVERLLGSNKKLQKLTKWKPDYSLKEGLAQTVEWFREHAGRYKTGTIIL